MSEAKNHPLLDATGLPRFDAIGPEHVEPDIRALLEELRLFQREQAAEGSPQEVGGAHRPRQARAREVVQVEAIRHRLGILQDAVQEFRLRVACAHPHRARREPS